MTLPRPTLPRHRHITPAGWAFLGCLAFWLGVALLIVRCA